MFTLIALGVLSASGAYVTTEMMYAAAAVDVVAWLVVGSAVSIIMGGD